MTVTGPPSPRKPKRSAKPRQYRPKTADLLAWYDRHRRDLPWRAEPGERADPYRVWLSEIMLQQTTVAAVKPYYARFLDRFPTVSALAAADLEEVLKLWAGLGYYARARNLHACARRVVERHRGDFPATEDMLAEMPGIGPYTAAAIAAIAYNVKASPVDGNIERVISRLYAIEDELPAAKPAIRASAAALTPDARPGDFAQAMMDLGATICTPTSPACALCPWRDACLAFKRGDADTFPRKAKKREGKLRRGAAFVVVRADDHILLNTRPEKGLLGGMSEVPTGAWTHDFDAARAADDAPRLNGASPAWRRVPGIVTHVFTHFPLELSVFATRVPARAKPPAGMRFAPLSTLAGEALPNVMRKVVAHALADLLPQDASKSPLRRRAAR